MKPVISGVTSTNPTVANGTDGTLIIGGLTANTAYGVSYNKNGDHQSATLTADADGNIVIPAGAGTYSAFIVADSTDPQNGLSDAFVGTVVLTDPAVVDSGTGNGTGKDTTGAGTTAPIDPSIVSDAVKGVVNNYFGNCHGKDAREAVIIGSEAFIKDIRNLSASTGALPETNNLLGIFQNTMISLVEDTTTVYLEKLANQPAS